MTGTATDPATQSPGPTGPASNAAEALAQRSHTPAQRVQHLLHSHPAISPAVLLLLTVVIFSLINPNFAQPNSLSLLVQQTAVVAGLAVGQTLIILTAGIDLSVAMVAVMSSLVMAKLASEQGVPAVLAILVGVAVGAAAGAVNGALVTKVGLPPFIVTLATLYLIQGAAFVISTTPTGQVTSALSSIALQRVGPVPYSFAVLVVALLTVGFVLGRTAFGRQLYAVGGDPAAARSNGVPVAKVLVTAYVLAGVLAALAGILLSARATIGSPTAGQGLELSAITVVVLGGTSLLGGRGSLVGTMGGVLLLSLVSSSVTLLQLPATLTELIRGVVILAAAALFVARVRR